MDLKKIVGMNIIRIRTVENLNQTALAQKISITRKHLCKIERGEVFPSAEILQEIADGLSVPVKELFVDPETTEALDLYTHSLRAMEKLLPTFSQMLAKEIIADIVCSNTKNKEGLDNEDEAPETDKNSVTYSQEQP